MLTGDQIISRLREQQLYLANRYGVKRIGLFGSYAGGAPHADSDIDIVIEFEQPIGWQFVELADYLEQLLGHKVDILTPAGLQTIHIKGVAEAITESIVYV